MDEVDRRHRESARDLVARIAGAEKLRWIEADDSDAARLPWNLARRALTSDLLVLGQFDPSDRDAGAVPPDLVTTAIVDSGKPALVVPCAGTFDAAPTSVLLAWKPTSEAARAAVAALPWLTKAREVHIAASEEPGEPMQLDQVEHWLRLNGVAGAVERHSLSNMEIGVGEALLSLATDVGAGLLAMGCYGHSRAREWVVGGVTRTVLRSMTVPTLMVH
jgi:nucleotide-binding universal stress UspA family protein